MISSIQGRIIEIKRDSLILELGGIGIQVYVPTQTKSQSNVGENIFLFGHLVIRDDAIMLFGFETSKQRDFFELLLGVSGVGPKSSLAILSVFDPETIQRAVVNEQAEIFTNVPGIGKKTAQQIILYLEDRLPKGQILEPIKLLSEMDSELLNALTSLGYSVIEAQRAIQSLPDDSPQIIEERLTMALQYFAKP